MPTMTLHLVGQGQSDAMVTMAYTPPPKRPCRRGERERSTSTIVLRLSPKIHDYLNLEELLRYALIPGLEFLKDDELIDIHELCKYKPSGYLVTSILTFLKTREESRREDDFRKFIACINKASAHRGHKEIIKMIRAKLGKEEWLLIEAIEDEAETPQPSPYATPQNSPAPSRLIMIQSPEKPMTLISLQGQLMEEEFMDMDRKLWLSFSKGSYEDLEGLIRIVKEMHGRLDRDCQIVALWFQALIMMHHHKDYNAAITTLDEALDLTCSCDNETILVGRILQRKAQVYLMKGQKNNAARDFGRAKEHLQFVGRGYDKTNMYCREAKVLSATEPHRRADIEKIYQNALGTLEKDDPYFLASYPSVTLSKAAFHLHFAFGSKLTKKDQLPAVSSEDIQKARQTLAGFSEEEHILIDMRRCEYDLIQAELCRLEGKEEAAHSRFTRLVHAADKSGNITSIAEHRLKWIH